MGSKFDIENFTSSNDFGLWKVKMKTILVHNKCVDALKGEAQRSCGQGEDHGGYTLVETRFE
ncbi:glutamate receptor 3.6, partial [Trifolium medium]|nr:glutamate receptor 3.6 [Trifolium medium]